MTVVLLTCSYKDREFVRVGYYVNNEYIEEEMRENPPARPVIEKVHVRNFTTGIIFCFDIQSTLSMKTPSGPAPTVHFTEVLTL